jgi:hypothetical protein
MAITIDQLEALMQGQAIKFFRHPDSAAFYLPFSGFGVYVRLLEDGEFLLWRSSSAMGLARLTSEQRRHVLERLMELHNRIKMGRFAIDDNEIIFEVGVSLEDGELTAKQFRRCLATVCHHADELRNDDSATASQSAKGSLSSLIERMRSRGDGASG